MEKYSKTYRLFTLFVAAVVAISISLPSVLMAAHCDMNMDSPATEMSSDHCPLPADHQHAEAHDHQRTQNGDCDSTLSCDCDFNQSQIKAEVIPSINKTDELIVVSVAQFIDKKPTETPSFFTNTDFSTHTETPPLFLLNSVFLN